MKKIFFFIAFFSNLVFADVFFDADTALKHAEKTNRLLVIFAVTDSCSHCHDFLNNLNSNGTMDILSKKYDVAILEIKNNLDIFTEIFTLSVTPTTFVLDPKKPEIRIPEVKGKVDSNSLLNYLTSVERELLKIR